MFSPDGQMQSGDPFSDDDYAERGARRPHVFREVLETIVLTLLIFFVVRAVVQNFKVEGDSMLPTLHTDQYLLVNKGLYFRYDANFFAHLGNPDAPSDMRYLFHGPQRGDIVVFEAWNEKRDFIKRVIATEGETVEVKSDTDPNDEPTQDCQGCCDSCAVYVNGVKLNEPYINAKPDYKVRRMVIPPGHIYVLGDNRRNSSDSHAPGNGPLRVDSIIGTAFLSYWPQDRWGLLSHPTYAEMEQK
jgi:signal peptidase I